ncbi:hypothetical protein [Candidatus Enterococcus clewellii]|uniref:DUF4352 domain-containing protein n=1 Tax=Candidatus Enterococcus clewellii TaxID=1834193 RepID=A0A242KCH1_9ENTE|nr:hypothetical protein [Enterococcus sp. 9E7_DIV0242]OTP18757.1 hypothetical protein A5888_000571 [Enterococcus sp. 9E7_DIV0242]
MKQFIVCVTLLLLLSGCSNFDTTENKETPVTASTSHHIEPDTGVEFEFVPDKQLLKIANNSKKLVTINRSETAFFKKEGTNWIGEVGGRGAIFMTQNLLPGETSEDMFQVPFDTGTIKGVFSYSIDQEEYTKEIVFEK